MSGLRLWETVPEHWRVLRNRLVFRERNERDCVELPLVAVSQKHGVMGKRELEAMEGRKLSGENDDLSNYKRVEPGDIVYNKMRMWQGAVGVSGLRGIASPAYVVATPLQGLDSRFAAYLLKSVPYVFQSGLFSYGICDDQNSLRWEDFANLETPIPPEGEQTRIANFLDEQTARIDALIAEKERLSELLGEHRSSLITAEVTGKEAPYDTIPLKRLIKSIESGVSVNAIDVPVENSDIGVLKTSCVYSGVFDSLQNKAVIPEELGRVSCPVQANTLIVSRMNTPDLVGAAGFCGKDEPNLYLPDRLWQVRFYEEKCYPRFIYWWTHTVLYRDQVKGACAGTSSSMQNLDQESFRSFVVPLPPLDVQRCISDSISCEAARIDGLREACVEGVRALREYRSSLISAAVTGQLNVDSLGRDG